MNYLYVSKAGTDCGGPYPAVLRCPRTRRDTSSCSVCTPDTQWQGHTTRRCPRPCAQFCKVLPQLVRAYHSLGEHRQEETTTSSAASIRKGADRRRGRVRRVAESELKRAEEDTTKASAGTLVLACRFAGWP